MQASNGDFYRVTRFGGGTIVTDGAGVLFKMTPSGAGLTQATNGTIYGTTLEGANTKCGGQGCGTVFSLSVGLGPFVTATPNVAPAGRIVKILGNGLTGTINVTFNATTATFTVVSDTYIQATVPNTATTGTIEVTTPGGTLYGNVPFQVQ